MTKNIIEDVRPPRSIRDIPIPNNRKPSRAQEPEEDVDDFEEESPASSDSSQQPPQQYPQTHYQIHEDPEHIRHFSKSKYLLWIIVLVCVAVLFVAVSSFFTSATLTVTPKSETADVLATVPIVNAANAGSATSSVAYQLISVTDTATTTVASTGQQQVSTKATGQIIVYNNYSSASKALIANTRFESSGGLVYRIASPITIPGKTASGPGSVTVTVTADQPGSNYNIGLTDFTVPGLESDAAEYKGIYGRSKTAMAGGAQGEQAAVSASAFSVAQTTLKARLATELLTEAQSYTPSQYIFYPNTATTTFQSVANTSLSSSTIQVVERGTVNAVVLNGPQLASALASQSLPGYDGSPVAIPNINQLNVSLVSSNGAPASPTTATAVSVNSNATFVWQYSSTSVKNAFKGVYDKNIPTVLANFPSISKASVIIRPFWISTLPKDPSKITIVTAGSN